MLRSITAFVLFVLPFSVSATVLLQQTDSSFSSTNAIIDVGETAGQVIQCSDVNGVITDVQVYIGKHDVGSSAWPIDITVGIGGNGATSTASNVQVSATGTVDIGVADLDSGTEFIDCSDGTGEFLFWIEPYDDGGVYPNLNRIRPYGSADDTAYGGTSSHCYDTHQDESQFTECMRTSSERRDLYFVFEENSASETSSSTTYFADVAIPPQNYIYLVGTSTCTDTASGTTCVYDYSTTTDYVLETNDLGRNIFNLFLIFVISFWSIIAVTRLLYRK